MAVNRRFTSRLSIRHAFKASVSVSARYLVQLTNIPSAGTAVSLHADSIAADLLFSSCREITLLCFQAITLITHTSFYLKKKTKKLGLAFGSKPGDRVMTADMFSQFLLNKLLHKFVLFHPDGCHSDALASDGASASPRISCASARQVHSRRSGGPADLKVAVVHPGNSGEFA